MNTNIAKHLSLPGGGDPLEVTFSDESGLGVLTSREKGVKVPVCHGMPLFTEMVQDADLARRVLRERFDDGGRYAEFAREKFRRPVYDAYGGFQPFNEAGRAIFPFLPFMSAPLKPGDLILDLSNRNGWTGDVLAGLFPEQQVLSLWDGNSGVLGYAGFSFWFGPESRAPNLTIGFHPVGDGIPLRDGSVRLVVGYDCLHRFDASRLLDECRRVMAPDATMIFPHVHLESDTPQFERGGTHLSARAYRRLLDEKFAGDSRKGFVFSERHVFDDAYPAVKDDSETSHYNGTVFIGPRAIEGQATAKCRLPEPRADFRLLVNPLCDIDLDRRRVTPGAANMGEQGAHMLSRHPVYRERLDRCLPRDLSTPECEILYWASRCLTLGEIAERTALPLSDVIAAARRFEESEIALAYPVTEAMARLHHYYGTQRFLQPRAKQTIAELWRNAAAVHASRKLFVYAGDDSEFTYEDSAQGVDRVARALVAAGLKKGDVIAADADLNPEFALLFWAAMTRGIVVAPMNTTWPESTTTGVLDECRPKLLFAQARRAGGRPGVIVFDSSVEESASCAPGGGKLFSDWLETADALEDAPLPDAAVGERDVAVMIFTSGTTGAPKGVRLSHGALYRSGRIVVEEFGWTSADVLLIPGEFHTMSGLRSPLIACLHAGASFVLTTQAQRRHPLSVLPVAAHAGATVLTVTPAFLMELGKAKERVPDAALPAVRLILSTASALSPAGAEALRSFGNITLRDYYGLTETAGACAFADPIDLSAPGGIPAWEPGLIGHPAGIIAHIVADDGRRLPPNEVGELCIYTENAMSGYLNRPGEAAEMMRDGWLHTGDLAIALPDGQIALKGRRREIIKDDFGEIIFPAEIEAALAGEANVEEVAVSGFTDPATGREALVVFVVPKNPGAAAENLVPPLRRRLQDTVGARKVPKHFDVVEKLPRNSLGKVVKRDLVAAYLQKTRNGK